MNRTREPTPRWPEPSAAITESATSLWCDEKALTFLGRQLRSSHYDHVVLTGWKSVDLFGNADLKAVAFCDSVSAALDGGKRVSIVIGGILTAEDFNTLLFDMRRVFAKSNLRRHFDARRLRFARDNARKPFHAKCWAFWKKNTVVDFVVGSFNLSAASFLRNVEAAARVASHQTDDLVRHIEQILEQGAISPHVFADIEGNIESKRPASEAPTEKRELHYLKAFEKEHVRAGDTAWIPRTPTLLAPTLSDFFVVLRNPSRNERVGYHIPEDLLSDIFGPDFLGTKETEMGVIQGPRSLIVPFPLHLAKEYRNRMAAMSKELTSSCMPSSVGYAIRGASKEVLRERLDEKFKANEQTKKKLKDFVESRDFPKFLMQQISAQIGELRKRYAKQVKLSAKALALKLEPKRLEILDLARKAAKQMLERLDQERTVSFVSLDKLLEVTEGISRVEIERELTRG